MASSRISGFNEHVSTYDSAGGKDYSVIMAWESDTDYDLVTAEVSEVLEGYKGNHNDYIAFDGATTNEQYRRILRPAGTIGEENWQGHSGIPLYDGSVFALNKNEGNAITIAEQFVSIQDVVLKSNTTATWSSASAIHINSTGHNTNIVGIIANDCYSADGDAYGVYIYNNVTGIVIENSNIFNQDYGVSSVDSGVVIRNSTICNNVVGLFGWGNNVRTGVNLILEGNNTTVNNPADWTLTNCTNKNGVIFVDSGNNNYLLDSSDTIAIDQGADLSAYFDDDGLGNVRPYGSAWDIGFHEYTVGSQYYINSFNSLLPENIDKINNISLHSISKINGVNI